MTTFALQRYDSGIACGKEMSLRVQEQLQNIQEMTVPSPVRMPRLPELLASIGLIGAALCANAPAQDRFPSKPITLIVPGAAGSSSDNIARVYGDFLGRRLGQSVIIVDRPGGNGAVAASALAAARPDGYTLMFPPTSTIVLASMTMKNPPFDAEKDFALVAQAVAIPYAIVVGANEPIRTIADILKAGKEKDLFYASAFGALSVPRLIGESMKQHGATKFTPVPYPASPAAHVDVIGGRIPVMIDGLGGVAQHVKAGKMRLIAVTTPQRVSGYPDVPTLAETIPGLIVPGMFAVVAAAGTPVPILEQLNRESRAVAQDPKANEQYGNYGAVGAPATRDELDRLLKSQRIMFKTLMEQAKLQPE